MNCLSRNKKLYSVFLPSISQKGSVLVLVMAVLMVLSLMALSVGGSVRQKLQMVSRLENREKLRLTADAAAQRILTLLQERQGQVRSVHALNAAWAHGDDFWKKTDVGNQMSYTVTVDPAFHSQGAHFGLVDENRKININTAHPAVLQKLFEITGGLDTEEARRLTAAVRDWVDEDEDLNDGGAETKHYASLRPPYYSQNSPLRDLVQLHWVRGMTPSVWSRVAPYLTLSSERINLNTAPKPVLEAAGIESSLAEKIVKYRVGQDGLAGTRDDGVFDSVSGVAEKLTESVYLSEEARENLNAAISPHFTVSSDFFQAQIEASIEHQSARLKVTMVSDLQGKVISWREEFL